MAQGIHADWHCHYWLEEDDVTRKRPNADKPSYRVPSMEEIRIVPWNGLRVVSTFSGCGGSCLGYRMAGFKVIWANEFVPAAQDSYRANMEPGTILDGRDIRSVKPEEILEATGLQPGELDLFDGSPPCQAFSTAGKREKGWGEAKVYEHGARQCNETLGVAKGYFIEILTALKACGYRVKARLLDAQWLGVPQGRQRIIFIGVRENLGRDPVHPEPLQYRYSVRDALPCIDRIRIHGNTWSSGGNRPSPAIVTSDANRGANAQFSAGGWIETEMAEKRKFTIAELKRVCAFPDNFVLTGTYAQQWERLGNSVPPLMMRAIAETVRDRILNYARAA
jgi:DNA (cytosine-5)-methyltransferase 1